MISPYMRLDTAVYRISTIVNCPILDPMGPLLTMASEEEVNNLISAISLSWDFPNLVIVMRVASVAFTTSAVSRVSLVSPEYERRIATSPLRKLVAARICSWGSGLESVILLILRNLLLASFATRPEDHTP